ncbi:MAG: hypothetical protein IT315_00805 [Anaerolineales bacterium]|nr:hypothetical protein [Anaerolineales bacterium]
MTRNIVSRTLIVLSGFFLLLSVIGIPAVWLLNDPLTREGVTRLGEIESALRQGEEALDRSRVELERALGILDSTEQALNDFTQNDPQAFFEDVQTTLDDELVPELKTAKERLITARDTLENARVTVLGLNIIPFININIPDETLADLIDSADALESKIGDVSDLAEQASVLLDSASQLFSGDFEATRASLEGFLAEVDGYQQKVTGWRAQVEDAKSNLPMWIDSASIVLTIFFLWFGLSQVSLFLHGRAILRGENPWEGLRSSFPFRDVSERGG